MFDDLLNKKFNSEQDFRLAILNTLLRTPHRDVAPYMPLFAAVLERDPLFFGRLSAWYFDHGSVHDLKQLFIAYMSCSKFADEYREAGLAMMMQLPPYQVERVIQMIKGSKRGDVTVKGISPGVPRSFKTAIEHYLRDRESSVEKFDNAVLHARKSMKTMYASFRIKPGEYAQRVLFDDNPPEGSKLYLLKQIAQSSNPTEQAKMIVENKIPYRIAISLIKKVTPAALVAIVAAMTPQEVINNMSSLKRRGAMDNVELRKLIEKKLEDAKTDKRVSALKTRQAMKAAALDEEMARKVEEVGDKQIKAKGTIKRPTALFIDKSGSMEQAIEVGKQIASIVAPVCEAGLYVYAFDVMAFPIVAQGKELSDWEKAFKGITANGGTSCGVPFLMMTKAKQRAEQIVVVTDQAENNNPRMAVAIKTYSQQDFVNFEPSVMIVNVGTACQVLENSLKAVGIEVDTYTFNGDYYSLPNLIPLLAGGTRLELLMEIMTYPLPERAKKVLAPATAST